LRRVNKDLGDRLAYLMSPQELDARLRHLNLDLQVPLPQQIVVLVERRHPVARTRTSEHQADLRTASR